MLLEQWRRFDFIKHSEKVMSKMGITTYQSYCGAQIFDAVNLSSAFMNNYFTGTAITIEGANLEQIAQEAVRWHENAYGNKAYGVRKKPSR